MSAGEPNPTGDDNHNMTTKTGATNLFMTHTLTNNLVNLSKALAVCRLTLVQS
jgi:hypothetical protein